MNLCKHHLSELKQANVRFIVVPLLKPCAMLDKILLRFRFCVFPLLCHSGFISELSSLLLGYLEHQALELTVTKLSTRQINSDKIYMYMCM